jgi:phospholipid transport system substrate-binding protein
MPSNPSRRTVLALVSGALALAVSPRAASAFTVDDARGLVDKVVGEINATIASGQSESAMIREFEKTFSRYADVPVIARSALGPAARGAPAGEMSAYTKAFQGYISRKYGKRFREFIGGRIEVTGARPVKSYFEVVSTAVLKGQAPFEVRWHVSDKSGKRLFFNLIIEGVNMLASERAEIGAMLDQAGGSIPGLTEALKKAG